MKPADKYGIKVGDLVRFCIDSKTLPPKVIPKENPIGIVLDIFRIKIGSEPKTQCFLDLAKVRWNCPKWNSKKGASEEHPGDLVLVQSLESISKDYDTYE